METTKNTIKRINNSKKTRQQNKLQVYVFLFKVKHNYMAKHKLKQRLWQNQKHEHKKQSCAQRKA
jgi:hypothetical protein